MADGAVGPIWEHFLGDHEIKEPSSVVPQDFMSSDQNNAGGEDVGSSGPAAPSKYVPPHMRRKMQEQEKAAAAAPARREAPSGGGWGRGSSRDERDQEPAPVNSRAEALAGWGGGGGRDSAPRGGGDRGDRLAPPSDWGRGGGGGGRDDFRGGGGYDRGPPPPEPGPNSRAARMMEGFNSRPSDFGGGGGGGDWGGSRGGGGRGFGRADREEDIFGPPPQNGASSAGINFDKYDDIPISVSAATPDGVVPDPIQQFNEVEMPQFLIDNIGRCHYTRPTPVQKHSIGIVKAGGDLMACAQTGSGKTGAFLIPAVINIAKQPPNRQGSAPPGTRGRCAHPVCVVMAPTRELVEQIYNDARKFVYKSPIQTVAVFGGEGTMGPQLRELERGCDLLLATPGRLHDMIERGRIDMGEVWTLILDEADRMLDMGFEPQIRRIVEQTSMPTREAGRQTLMFSATFPPAIQHLAQDFLRDYTYLTVGRVGSTTDNITQQFEFCDQHDKLNILFDLIEDAKRRETEKNKDGLTLIFVETKRDADILEDELSHAGFAATSIHGDRSQPERQEALKSFKAGRTPYLVATDVASRGLDIPNVSHVINYDCPSDFDSYVHRIGRTGRAGRTGVATAFLTMRDTRIAVNLLTLLEEANQNIPEELQRMAAQAGYGGGGGGRGGGRSRREDQSRDVRGSGREQTWGREREPEPQVRSGNASKLMTTGGSNMADFMVQASAKAPKSAPAPKVADTWDDEPVGAGDAWWDDEE